MGEAFLTGAGLWLQMFVASAMFNGGKMRTKSKSNHTFFREWNGYTRTGKHRYD